MLSAVLRQAVALRAGFDYTAIFPISQSSLLFSLSINHGVVKGRLPLKLYSSSDGMHVITDENLYAACLLHVEYAPQRRPTGIVSFYFPLNYAYKRVFKFVLACF